MPSLYRMDQQKTSELSPSIAEANEYTHEIVVLIGTTNRQIPNVSRGFHCADHCNFHTTTHKTILLSPIGLIYGNYTEIHIIRQASSFEGSNNSISNAREWSLPPPPSNTAPNFSLEHCSYSDVFDEHSYPSHCEQRNFTFDRKSFARQTQRQTFRAIPTNMSFCHLGHFNFVCFLALWRRIFNDCFAKI